MSSKGSLQCIREIKQHDHDHERHGSYVRKGSLVFVFWFLMAVMSDEHTQSSLFAIDFKEIRKLHLSLYSYGSFPECRRKISADSLKPSNVFNFLGKMRHLTNLILALSNYRFGAFNISDLYFPALRALDISGNDAPTGLIPFVAKHASLHILHVRFDYGPLPAPFQDQDLLKLRALMMSARNNTGVFSTFLSKHSESEEETCARRPHLDHLCIYNVDSLHYLRAYVQPLGRQLRRLDLHFLVRMPVFEDGFSTFLASFTALVELSITLRRQVNIAAISVPALSEGYLVSHLNLSSSMTD